MSTSYLDKDGLTYLWGKIKSKFLRGNVGGVFYGTCSTGAGTVAKVVTCDSFTADDLVAGTIIVVTFTATNSGAVANLTMNVNGTGAKHIKYINNGTLGNLSSAGYLKANTEYPFYYDGANWVVWMNVNTTYSALSEADMHTGTATTARLITAQRLKQAVEYHAPVTSVNGQTGAVTIAVPDAVSVDQKLSSGTNIADITIGDATTHLYAPSGGTVTETDPVFSASPAGGITSTDITNWNARSDIQNIKDGSGVLSIVMNTLSTATGAEAVSLGYMTNANGNDSFAQGRGSIANCKSQCAIGEFNVSDTGGNASTKGNYAFIIGNGASSGARSNAFTVDWNGRMQCGDYSGTLKSIFDIFYPVGSYYETSDSSFDPNTAWGGTWVLDSKGRVTVSRDETITDFDTIGETGGEKTVTLTVDEMPNHSHKVRYTGRSANGNYGGMSGTSVDANPAYNNMLVAYEGGGQAHNNMPPYVVVNRWHRTA
jgi:hypothetical protein